MSDVLDHNARSVTPAVLRWAAIAVGLDVSIVVGAHLHDAVFRFAFLAGGLASATAAVLYTRAVGKSLADSAWHGGMVAGIGGFIASALSASLADQRPLVMLWATLGALGVGACAGVAALGFREPRPRGPERQFGVRRR